MGMSTNAKQLLKNQNKINFRTSTRLDVSGTTMQLYRRQSFSQDTGFEEKKNHIAYILW